MAVLDGSLVKPVLLWKKNLRENNIDGATVLEGQVRQGTLLLYKDRRTGFQLIAQTFTQATITKLQLLMAIVAYSELSFKELYSNRVFQTVEFLNTSAATSRGCFGAQSWFKSDPGAF